MRFHPIIWVIGPSRSSKTAMAKGISGKGPEALGYPVFATGKYYRDQFGQPDSFDSAFIFNISAHTCRSFINNKTGHQKDLIKFLSQANSSVIIEGERNPFVFSRFFTPDKDMVFLMDRRNIESYATDIEPGVDAIEHNLRWGVKSGFVPQSHVTRFTFGEGDVTASNLPGQNQDEDRILYHSREFLRYKDDPYPWMGTLVPLAQDMIHESGCFHKSSLYQAIPADPRHEY